MAVGCAGLAGTVVLLAFQTAHAGGWVKDSGNFYVKGSWGIPSTQRYRPSDAALRLDTETSTYGIYAEVGLPGLWPVQINFASSYKSILRQSPSFDDKLKNASVTDTRLVSQHSLFAGELAPGVGLAVATRLGAVLPTTPEDFRSGEESRRFNKVPAGREPLVTGVDRGELAWTLGSGASVSFSPVWLSLDMDVTSASDATFAAQQSAVALGVGLPWNSWFQISFSQNKDPYVALDQAGVPSVESTTETRASAALGLTVWNGLALEGDASYHQTSAQDWEDWWSFSSGISYRTL